MALTYNNQFEVELRKLINAEIGRLAENLSLGTSVTDYPGYRHEVGQLAALRKTLEMCDDVRTEMDKR